MAETAAAVPASPPKSPKKKMTAGKKKTGSKAPANHPPYQSMTKNAIKTMKEMKGSSRQAILKFLMANYQVGGDAIKINAHLKMALKRMVKSGDLKQLKGTGASGRFRLGDKAKKSGEGKPRKRTAKKTGKAKKSRAPKMAKMTTPAATGEAVAASPAKKSTKKQKSPKKVTKKTTKPKKARSPAKKTGAKKSPKKKMAKKSSPKKMKKTMKAPAVATA